MAPPDGAWRVEVLSRCTSSVGTTVRWSYFEMLQSIIFYESRPESRALYASRARRSKRGTGAAHAAPRLRNVRCLMAQALAVAELHLHSEGVTGNTEQHRQILTRRPFDCLSTALACLRRTEVDEIELITAITRRRNDVILRPRQISLLKQFIAHSSSVPLRRSSVDCPPADVLSTPCHERRVVSANDTERPAAVGLPPSPISDRQPSGYLPP
jgi:hypothetical protein